MDSIKVNSVTVLADSAGRRSLGRLSQVALVAGCLLLAGCGQPPGPPRFAIGGNVVREGKPIEDGLIQMVPTGGGPAAQTAIKAGKFQFTKENGPIAGKQNTVITRLLARAEVPAGTPKKDAELIPETGFSKPMPPNGWLIEFTVANDQDVSKPVSFDVDTATAAPTPGARREKQ